MMERAILYSPVIVITTGFNSGGNEMKKICFSAICLAVFPFYANAIPVMPVGCSFCTGMETDAGNNSGTGCASTQYVCHMQLRYLDCTSCKSGYMRVEHVLSDTCSYWSCQYGCAAGEYYTVSGCYDCPYPGTSASGTSSITGCYIPANQLTGSDSTGSWTCTSAAYYQN